MNLKRFFDSIIFRLIVIVVSFFIIFGIINIVTIQRVAKKNYAELVNKEQLAFSNYIAEHIDLIIIKGLNFITDFSDRLSSELIQDKDRLNSWITGNLLIPPIFNYGLVIISPSGDNLIAESKIIQGRKDLDFSKVEWFRKAKSAEKTILSKPFRNRINNQPTIIFASPLRNENGELLAIVAGSVELAHKEFLDIIYDFPIGESGGILVISPEDSLFVASSNDEMIFKPTPAPGINILHDRAMAGYRGVGKTINAYGAEELVAISSINSTGWFVVVRMPVEEVYQSISGLSRVQIVYISLGIILMVIILITWLLILLRPLVSTAKSVHSMSKGKETLHKFPVKKHNEIGYMVEGFNNLVDTINDRTKSLEDAKEELEQRLKEVKELSGLLPICSFCKKIRDDDGYWNQVDRYIAKKTDALFSHSICPECMKENYPFMKDEDLQ
ncbi:hypothetical protein HNV12_04935 [Methanococcoides sp. SA1]|nr:hypothetical protein [Methanococcoides sp. SA1]